MKTIKEWLSEIEDKDVREKALKNAVPENLLYTAKDIGYALLSAFRWRTSPEGFEYWETQKDKTQRNQRVPYSELDGE